MQTSTDWPKKSFQYSNLFTHASLTGSQEQHNAEHGEDGRHHYPKKSVQFPGVLAGCLRAGFRGDVWLGAACHCGYRQTAYSWGDQRSAFVRHGCWEDCLLSLWQRNQRTGFKQTHSGNSEFISHAHFPIFNINTVTFIQVFIQVHCVLNTFSLFQGQSSTFFSPQNTTSVSFHDV